MARALKNKACVGQAVLLTNGIDYRVHPLADKDHPKSALPVGDVPIIEHQLRLLELAGYHSEQLPPLLMYPYPSSAATAPWSRIQCCAVLSRPSLRHVDP